MIFNRFLFHFYDLHFSPFAHLQAGRTNPNVSLTVTDITADKVTFVPLAAPADIIHMSVTVENA